MVAHPKMLIWMITLASVLIFASAEAQWQLDGVPVCTAAGAQNQPVAVPSGSGGLIIVWQDARANSHIYAQRLDAAGVPLWSSNGILLSSVVKSQNTPVAVGDGFGGAFVAWVEPKSGSSGAGDVYAQHVRSDGVLLWGSSGVPLCQAGGYKFGVAMISDNRRSEVIGQEPGAIVTWQDGRSSGTDADIYAQAVNAAGVVRWTADGVAVCTAQKYQSPPTLVTDDTGFASSPKGAIITWEDKRSSITGDIYAQRLNSSGVPQWGADGIGVCTNSLSQSSPALASNLSGSAIIAWYDTRGGGSDIYAQRVGAGGSWLADGLPVCRASGTQSEIKVIRDGAGGAIIVWYDGRSLPTLGNIYAQRVDGTGSMLWTVDGVALCQATGEQISPTVVADALGGATVVWRDLRGGTESDLYVQHVDAAGGVSWAPDGLPLCQAPGNQSEAAAITDGVGSAIVAWTDTRSGNQDIYANRVAGGVADVGPTGFKSFRLLAPIPNPTSGAVTMSFELPAPARVTAQIFSVDGRLIRTLAEGEAFGAGLRTLSWDGRGAAHERLFGGIYFERVRAGAESDVRKILIMP